jgi:anti-sigma-K factor RskA
LDINKYIESGIIENYVLNNLSDQERQEVECMSHIYPEIKEEILNLQNLFEKIATHEKKEVPKQLKISIMNKIQNLPQNNTNDNNQTKVIQLKKTTWIIPSIAASIILILSISYLWQNTYKKLIDVSLLSQKIEKENKELQEVILSKELEYFKNLSKDSILIAHLTNPNTQVIPLEGSDKYYGASATIYWNKETKETYINSSKLIEIDSQFQYQLWAIVDGKPLDLGVFDSSKSIQIASNVSNPQAFAITKETRGGNPTPNLDELVVIGNI